MVIKKANEEMITDHAKHLLSHAYSKIDQKCDYYNLMFHSVSTERDDRYKITPKRLEEILRFVSIDLGKIYISFDDGLVCVYENARNIINHFGISPTLFLSTSCIGQNGYLTFKQIERLKLDGWHLGGHGHDHVALGRLTTQECRFQLEKSFAILQGINGQDSKIPMSLPFGSHNSETIILAQESGFDACYSSLYGGWNSGDYFRNRIEIWGSDNQHSVKRKLQGRYRFLAKNANVS